MTRACRAGLLVLDDLRAMTSAEASLLDEVFIRREQEGRPVVFTSNLTRKQLDAALSDRVLDRIRAWGDVHEVPGKSLR
jgi:DNA replication protein DnaC